MWYRRSCLCSDLPHLPILSFLSVSRLRGELLAFRSCAMSAIAAISDGPLPNPWVANSDFVRFRGLFRVSLVAHSRASCRLSPCFSISAIFGNTGDHGNFLHPLPLPPMYTHFHPRSPNMTQASAEGRNP